MINKSFNHLCVILCVTLRITSLDLFILASSVLINAGESGAAKRALIANNNNCDLTGIKTQQWLYPNHGKYLFRKTCDLISGHICGYGNSQKF